MRPVALVSGVRAVEVAGTWVFDVMVTWVLAGESSHHGWDGQCQRGEVPRQ